METTTNPNKQTNKDTLTHSPTIDDKKNAKQHDGATETTPSHVGSISITTHFRNR